MSSLTADYCARQKSNAMTFFVVEQIAILAPEKLRDAPDWLGSSVREWLSRRVLELIFTNDELGAFARDLGWDGSPFRWSVERRSLVQAEIDAAVLHLYGLDRGKTEWLIDSFAVLRKYEERDLGEFRTKRLVLEIYDEMAKARASGTAYQTRLSPPPADPSLCHA
jgi:hypothetical protein